MTGLDVARPVSAEATFQQYLNAGQLMVQHCVGCDRAIFFPRLHCPRCQRGAAAWRPMRLTGALYSYSDIPEGNTSPGRNVVLVDMDEGFRMMSTVPDIPADSLQIGMRLRARVEIQDGKGRVVFAEDRA